MSADIDTSSMSDARIIAAVRSGDGRALGVLYERFARPMLRVAYQLTGSVADAEDVMHDVFLGLPDALRRYEERGQLAAWLQRLTTRTALNALRTTARRRERTIDGERGAAGAMDPNGATSTASVTTAPAMTTRDASAVVAASIDLHQALLSLPDSLRTVFVLREIEQYSHAEIAQMLDISVSASEIRLCRAFKRLRATSRSG